MNKRTILYLITAVVLIAATYIIFTGPMSIDPGECPLWFSDLQWGQYIYVPLARVSYVAFFVVFIASICYLQTSDTKWDVLALFSAEIGIVFCSLNLLSGIICEMVAWSTYWEWNSRLTIQLVLLLVYVAYIMLRRAMVSENCAHASIFRVVYLLTAISLIVATYMVFTSPAIVPAISPELSDAEQKNILQSYRIFYFHVPLAWVSYLAFFLVFIASIRYLQTSHITWDALAVSSAEIGTVFCALNLLSGMMWAKGAWGIYWDWTPRLTFQLILFLLYAAYITLRRAMGSESRARSSAVFGIIAFAAVPMSYLSIKLWTPLLHPDLTGEGGGIDSPIIVYTLLINILAYTLLYLSLLTIRMDNERALAESASSRNP